MTTNYAFAYPTLQLFSTTLDFIFKRLLPLSLLVCFCFTGAAQQKNGKKGKKKNNHDITISSCIQDMGNGLLRVNFSYNNPNDEVITVANGLSKLLIKKGKKKIKSFALNTFQPGEVENAFFVDFFEMQFVQWTLKNPGGKTKKSKASSNTALCPEPPVIIPVYGQEGGKSDTPLGLELTSLAEGNAGDQPSEIVYQINSEDEVLVEIVPATGQMQAVINLLSTTYDRTYNQDPMLTDFIVDPARILSSGLATIDVFFPISDLLALNSETNINFIRPLYTPIRLEGIVNTQGDAAMLTDAVRDAFVIGREEDGSPIQVDGNGIKIGVISDSFDKQPASPGQPSRATVDVQNGDLPGSLNPSGYSTPVDVIKDFPYGVASDEGRAMLQIVHDIAPGAELAFSTGVLSPRDFALAIQDLAAAGCDIITDDITYPFEPFFGEGQISDAIREFTTGENSNGNAYFTSAGNFADRGYQSLFIPSSAPPVTNIAALDDATAHVFGQNPDLTEDVLQQISVVPGTYMIVLQWAEGLASQDNNNGATTDLDIFLVDDEGNLIVGNNRININGDAAEVLVFQATGSGTANILITRSSASGPLTGPLPMRYIAFRTSSDAGIADGLQFLEYDQGAPTVSGHAMTPEAITVGAVDYRVALNPSAQDFSSYAGILENNQLLEVDVSAPDGGNTNVTSIGQDIAADEDSFPNFFGTSAAAPHAAGAFALLKSAIPAWYPDGGLPVEISVTSNLLADQLLQIFKNTSVPAGIQENAGIGLIDANAAFQVLASQTAVLTGLAVEEGKVPSQEAFEVTINGKYLPTDNAPVVIFDEEEVEVLEGNTETEIKAIIEPFAGNPKLFVLTNGKTPAGTDGGLSNGLTFFAEGKIALNIIAEDIDIEFGQAYEFSYRVEGLPEDISYEDTGLPEILFSSPAVGPYPDVNNYVIQPNFGETELTPEQLEAYQINFLNGVLSVSPKDLLIKPENVSISYGETIEIALDYTYDETDIAENADFLEAINNAHEGDFFSENTLILINKLRAVINEQQILETLNNRSWMASERIYQNKLRAVINGELNFIDLEVENFDNYLGQEEDPITNKLRAVINKLRAVINGDNLLRNQIDLVEPETNKLRAVINGTSLLNQNNFESYESIFAIVDLEDGAPEEEDPPRTVDNVYATNLLTGLDVTQAGEPSLIFPGAFIANFAANFNITYESAAITIAPATLQVQTPDLESVYGTELTNNVIDDLLANCDCPGIAIEGFVYGEDTATVFPEGFQYYLQDSFNSETQLSLNGDEGLLIPAGTYLLKIQDPLNYNIDFGEAVGTLTVTNKELIVSGNNGGEPLEVIYGDPISNDLLDDFVQINGLAEGDSLEDIFPDGIIPYFLEEISEDPQEEGVVLELGDKINTGDYFVRIEMPETNYNISYEQPLILSVTPAPLTIEIQQSDPVIYGENTATINYSITVDGLVSGDSQEDIFPGSVIPKYFEDVLEDEPRTRLEAGDPLKAGEYFIRVDTPSNYSIIYGDGHGTLTIDKATLNACIADVQIREGEVLYPGDIDLEGITGFVYEDTLESVFPEGLIYLVNGELLTEVGILLTEGEYSITIQDENLDNYTLVEGTTCSGTSKVFVTICGDATTLDFSSFHLVSGVNNELGSVYRFNNVTPNVHAIVTIVEKVGSHITQFDRNDGTNNEDFKPEIRFTQNNGGPEPRTKFRFEFVSAQDGSTPVVIDHLIMGLLDIDGQGLYQEFNQVSLPDQYTVNDPKRIQDPFISGIAGEYLRIQGSSIENGGVSNDNPEMNVEVVYKLVSSFEFTFGAGNSMNGFFNTGFSRQAAIQFSCLRNFVNPISTVLSPLGDDQGGTGIQDLGVVYPNPVSSILFVEPENITEGRLEIRDLVWGNVLISQTFDVFTSIPLEIDASALSPGLYALRIVGDGQILEYKFIKE